MTSIWTDARDFLFYVKQTFMNFARSSWLDFNWWVSYTLDDSRNLCLSLYETFNDKENEKFHHQELECNCSADCKVYDTFKMIIYLFVFFRHTSCSSLDGQTLKFTVQGWMIWVLSLRKKKNIESILWVQTERCFAMIRKVYFKSTQYLIQHKRTPGWIAINDDRVKQARAASLR